MNEDNFSKSSSDVEDIQALKLHCKDEKGVPCLWEIKFQSRYMEKNTLSQNQLKEKKNKYSYCHYAFYPLFAQETPY